MAHVILRAPSIWAAIIDEKVDVEAGNIMWLTENLVRRVSDEDLSAVLGVLLKKYGSAQALAERTGLPVDKIQRYAGHS
jgi:hypothetical protein